MQTINGRPYDPGPCLCPYCGTATPKATPRSAGVWAERQLARTAVQGARDYPLPAPPTPRVARETPSDRLPPRPTDQRVSTNTKPPTDRPSIIRRILNARKANT